MLKKRNGQENLKILPGQKNLKKNGYEILAYTLLFNKIINNNESSMTKKIPPSLIYESNTYLTLNTKSNIPITPPESSPTTATHNNNNNNEALTESTSQRSTSSSSSSSSNSVLSTLTYVGHVGELPNDYLYCVPGIPTTNPPNNLINEVKNWLKIQDGINNVEIMIPKMRISRNKNWEEPTPVVVESENSN